MAMTEKNYWYESRREPKPICGKYRFGLRTRFSYLTCVDGKMVRRWHNETMGSMPEQLQLSLSGMRQP